MIKDFLWARYRHSRLLQHPICRDFQIFTKVLITAEQIIEALFVNFIIVYKQLKLRIILFNRGIYKGEYVSYCPGYNSI